MRLLASGAAPSGRAIYKEFEMKKLLVLLLTIAAALPIMAQTERKENVLIAYFTVPETDGVDTVAGASRVVKNGEVLGNTQFIAQCIQRAAGGDLFAIETVQRYPGTHAPLLEFAADEKRKNGRPKLRTRISNLNQYDVIFIGYPNWNADLPPALYTFLEEYDFSGKTVVPFSTHGGSGFSNTIRTIARLEPRATVITNGFTVSRNTVGNAENNVRAWVKNLNLGQ
jgi:flavodoxin